MRYNNIELNLLFNIKKNYNYEKEQEERIRSIYLEMEQIFRT